MPPFLSALLLSMLLGLPVDGLEVLPSFYTAFTPSGVFAGHFPDPFAPILVNVLLGLALTCFILAAALLFRSYLRP